MAINPMQGLFAGGGNSLGSIQQKMQLEKQARIRQAMADNASAGGNYYSNLIAKSNAQLGETVKGVAQGLAGGGLGELGKDPNDPNSQGMLREALPQDPRLSAAITRDKDRQEIIGKLGKFATKGSDGDETITEKEIREGQGMLLAKGYVTEAGKFLEQAQSMRKLGQVDTDLNTKSAAQQSTQAAQEGQTNLGYKRLGFDETKQEWIERNADKGWDFKTEELNWKKESSRLDRNLVARGQDITSSRNSDLRVASDLDRALADKLGVGNLDVRRDANKISKFVADNNKAYGLVEQSRKATGQAATIRQADAALALRSTLGLRAADTADRGATVQERNAAVNEDRAKLEEYLGKGKFEYNMMATDRLYAMAMDKKEFEQALSLRQQGYTEYLDDAKMTLEGKKFEHRVLTDDAQLDLAEAEFGFRKFIGYENLDLDKSKVGLEKRRVKLMEMSNKHSMALDLTKQGFTEEKFWESHNLAKQRYVLDDMFREKNMNRQQQNAEVDQILRQSGHDLNTLNSKQKWELAGKEHELSKMLGIAGMETNQASLKLRQEIAQDDNRFRGNDQALKEFSLNLQEMDMKDLKEFRLLQLKSKESTSRMADLTKRRGQDMSLQGVLSGAAGSNIKPVKPVNNDIYLGAKGWLATNKETAERLGISTESGGELFSPSTWGKDEDQNKITNFASEIEGLIAVQPGLNRNTAAQMVANQMLGPKSSNTQKVYEAPVGEKP
jgi:hypothetical protein